MRCITMILLLIISIAGECAGYFLDVKSANYGESTPVLICLNAKAQISCQKYVIIGSDAMIKSYNITYSDAGIKVVEGSQKLHGCTPYSNGYCLFYVNSTSATHINLN